MSGSTREKPLSVAKIQGRHLALPINICLGWNDLPGTNIFVTLVSGQNVIEFYTAIIYVCSQLARVFVPYTPLKPSLIFSSKVRTTRVKHLSVAPLQGELLAIRLGWKGLSKSYKEHKQIMDVKSVQHFYSTFLFCFMMQTLSIISSIKNFNKHVLIDHFHFKHEMRIKEMLLN